mmetsp:Transcript_38428/g.34209  ORF Transcript_38428/g.34209 Transcript_38428/m.34209 type:complete len:155 (+) Transcript_38428:101-565(+)
MVYASEKQLPRDKMPTYTGLWRDGQPHGQGRMLYENGNVYEGDFQFGRRHGQGKLTMVSYNTVGDRLEDIYVGAFEGDLYSGYGTLTMNDGYYYKGEWFQGKRQGRGECRLANGRFYSGFFHEDDMLGAELGNIVKANDEDVELIERNLKKGII